MCMKKIIVLLLLFLYIGSFGMGCNVLRWQIKEVTFRVYAIQEDSEYYIPLVGAKIAISGTVYTAPSTTTSVSETVYTNYSGEVVVNLQPGTYTITVSKDGYGTVTQSIVLYTLQTSGGSYNFYLSEESTQQ